MAMRDHLLRYPDWVPVFYRQQEQKESSPLPTRRVSSRQRGV